MSDEQPMAAGRRRSKGADAAVRASALERLKALRSGGRRSEGGSQVKMEAPIYDTIDEEEYDALVAKRREEVRGFIIDDDGLGYGDEGQEEDWSKADLPPSSDESDGEFKRQKKRKEKKDIPPNKPSPLSAAAATVMGKQRISSMFTSSVFKKSREEKFKGLSSDSIVDDVIAEFAPDEQDRQRRKRGQTVPLLGAKNPASVPPVKSEDKFVSDVNLSAPVFTKVTTNSEFNVQNCNILEDKDLCNESEEAKDLNSAIQDHCMESTRSNGVEAVPEAVESLQDDVEMKAEPEVKKEVVSSLNAKIKEDRDPSFSATAGWQAVRSERNGDSRCSAEDAPPSFNDEENSDFVLDSDGSLPFYMLDAHEEFYGANSGTLYLFGKVK